MTDRTGQQLGNYRLVRLLGSGGFAEVYLGEHVHLNTKAAIKVLTARLTTEEIEQFRSEARTIARLRHPYIVRVLDFGVDYGIPFLVMDYAPNGTLRQRYPNGTRLSPTTILPHLKQVAAALQYAHDQKLVHRDVKPENMLLEPDNTILLSDFGIAVVAHSSHSMNTQDIIGTVAYMAPEQLQGKPRLASDQYALAVVVYEWLSGSWPFNGAYVEIAMQHALTPPPSLREKVPAISPEVEQVVMKALAKDPQQRFPSVRQFTEAFEQACQTAVRFDAPTRQSQPTPSPAIPPTPAVPPRIRSGSILPPSQAVSPSPAPPPPAQPRPGSVSGSAPPVPPAYRPSDNFFVTPPVARSPSMPQPAYRPADSAFSPPGSFIPPGYVLPQPSPKRFQPEDYRAARRWGVPCGVIAALAVGGAVSLTRALGIAGNAITPSTILIESLVYLVVLICPLCGLLAARQTGRVRSGVLAAFVVGALWVLAITIGVFYEDAVPKLSHESVVVLIAAYLVGLLVLAPIGGLIGGVLGALGGLVGRWRYRAHK
jgi:serine/threonine protein kinase